MPDKPPITILVVDDTEASRYAVSRILRQAQFAVREAATGEEALRLAAEKPDLVILDVNLPDMSGYEVCRRIKAAPPPPRRPCSTCPPASSRARTARRGWRAAPTAT